MGPIETQGAVSPIAARVLAKYNLDASEFMSGVITSIRKANEAVDAAKGMRCGGMNQLKVQDYLLVVVYTQHYKEMTLSSISELSPEIRTELQSALKVNGFGLEATCWGI
jgi:hypothetical protein